MFDGGFPGRFLNMPKQICPANCQQAEIYADSRFWKKKIRARKTFSIGSVWNCLCITTACME
jgi:hypothetical protein